MMPDPRYEVLAFHTAARATNVRTFALSGGLRSVVNAIEAASLRDFQRLRAQGPIMADGQTGPDV